MKKKPDEFGQLLDRYEQDIEDNFIDDFYPPKKAAKEMNLLRNAVLNSIQKDKEVNIKLNESMIVKLKNIAKNNGLKYQTLISKVLNKFIQKYIKEAH